MGVDFAVTNLIKSLVFEQFEKAGDYRSTNLSGANLGGANLRKANLRLADLRFANLSNANLSEANLLMANFKGANLSGADLTRTIALTANFTEVIFTGACIQEWNINSETSLDEAICKYVYLRYHQQERFPVDRDFVPGEFTKLFQKASSIVELIFHNGIDWISFAYSFGKLRIENEDAELAVQSIENKGDGVVVVKVKVSPNTDKTKIYQGFMQGYEFAQKALEVRYQARFEDKDKYINQLFILLQESQEKLGEVSKLMAEQPKIQQNFNNKVYGVAGNVEGNQNIYTSEQRQNLAEAAAEIQQLLYQLAQNNLTTTEAITEAVHQEIRHNPTLKARLQAALKAGGLEALKAIFNHPLFSIPAETIKGWLEAE